MEKAISMEPVKEKLCDLEKYMPKEHHSLYKFGKLLSDRINPEINPIGFYYAAETLLHDLQAGVDGFSGQPIRDSLAGNPPIFYTVLRWKIPHIAKAVCPEDFANGVKTAYEEVRKGIK